MRLVKPFFLAAQNIKAQKALKLLENKYSKYKLKNANVIVVLGGDGSILSLINNKDSNKTEKNKKFIHFSTKIFIIIYKNSQFKGFWGLVKL